MVCNKVPSQQQSDLNRKLWIIKNRDNRRVKIRQTEIPLYLVSRGSRWLLIGWETVTVWFHGNLRWRSRFLEAVFKGIIMFWLQSLQAHLLDVNRITSILLNWLIAANGLTLPGFLKWSFQWDYTFRSPFLWTKSYFTPLCGKYCIHKHATKPGL